MAFKKITKDTYFTIAFIIILSIFVLIVFRLPVNAFIIIMPIFAALIFLAIFLLPEDKEDKK